MESMCSATKESLNLDAVLYVRVETTHAQRPDPGYVDEDEDEIMFRRRNKEMLNSVNSLSAKNEYFPGFFCLFF